MNRDAIDITQLLHQWQQGNSGAMEQLIPLVYRELRLSAKRALARESKQAGLCPTELVHELFLRLIRQNRVQLMNRLHFFSLSTMIMRRILCDLARARKRTKRGGAVSILTLDPNQGPEAEAIFDFEELNQALNDLAERDPRAVQVVELKFFGGLTVSEIAEVVGVSEATINREWRMARVWLYQALNKGITS